MTQWGILGRSGMRWDSDTKMNRLYFQRIVDLKMKMMSFTHFHVIRDFCGTLNEKF